MKKSCAILAGLLIWGAAGAMGQPVPGKRFELGTSLNFVTIKYHDDPASGSLNIPVRLGWFIWKGLELEPELTISFPIGGTADHTAELMMIGHVTYNVRTAGALVPFIGAGVGAGTGTALGLGGVQDKGSGVTLFDALVGVKAVFGDVIGVRAEYRFNRYSFDIIFEPYTMRGTYHQVLVGLSLFF